MPFWYNNQKIINPSEFMTPDTFLENIYPSPTEIHWWCICYINPVTHKPQRHPINTGTHTHTCSLQTQGSAIHSWRKFLTFPYCPPRLKITLNIHLKCTFDIFKRHLSNIKWIFNHKICSYSQKRVPAFPSPTSLLAMLGRLWHLGPLCTSGAQTEANAGLVVYQSSFHTGVLTHPQK